jgi:hypothetical protein
MGRRVYLSFHIPDDHWRAKQVRKAWTTEEDHEAAGYVDPERWQELRRAGTDRIREWVDDELTDCDVTAVLIGDKTDGYELVNYEIKRSVAAGVGLVGIRVHNIEDADGDTAPRGSDPLDRYEINGTSLNEIFNTYDWQFENGPLNFDSWVDEAIETARRR